MIALHYFIIIFMVLVVALGLSWISKDDEAGFQRRCIFVMMAVVLYVAIDISHSLETLTQAP